MDLLLSIAFAIYGPQDRSSDGGDPMHDDGVRIGAGRTSNLLFTRLSEDRGRPVPLLDAAALA